MFFGQKVKELRLKYANKGLRNFSKEMEMSPSEYSNLERGFTPPSQKDEWFRNLLKKLEVPDLSEDEMALYILWGKPFVMQEMSEDMTPSPLTHKSDGTRLTKEELIGLCDHVKNIAVEHNKKAKEYNESK